MNSNGRAADGNEQILTRAGGKRWLCNPSVSPGSCRSSPEVVCSVCPSWSPLRRSVDRGGTASAAAAGSHLQHLHHRRHPYDRGGPLDDELCLLLSSPALQRALSVAGPGQWPADASQCQSYCQLLLLLLQEPSVVMMTWNGETHDDDAMSHTLIAERCLR